MKAIGLTAFFLLSVVSFAQAKSKDQDDDFGNSVGNDKYLSFNNKVECDNDRNSARRCLSNKQLVWQGQEVVKWKNAIRKAANMLPRKFFKKTGTISWEFFIDRNDWATAYAGFPVKVNLLSNYTSPPKWMTWEPFRKNGLTETERMYVAFHEIAHLSGDSFYWEYAYQYHGISWWNDNHLEAISSIHCLDSNSSDEIKVFSGLLYYQGTSFKVGNGVKSCHIHDFDKDYATRVYFPEKGEITLYSKEWGETEDFAETFAFYVMWPEYLKENFPKHYEVIKKILVREYKSVYPITSSIKSRLLVQ